MTISYQTPDKKGAQILQHSHKSSVSHSGLLDIRPAERWPFLSPPPYPRYHACNTITWPVRSLVLYLHSDAHVSTQVSLSPKNSPALVFSARGYVFFFAMPEFLFAFTFFPQIGGNENKNIIKGLKGITGCQSSESQSVYVCLCYAHVFWQRSKTCVCMYMNVSVCM